MSRLPGSDKAQVEARIAAEQLSFNLRFCVNELEITRLRIEQAVRRDPSLGDLLMPGVQELDKVMRWLQEVTPIQTGGGSVSIRSEERGTTQQPAGSE